jgi:hypothetical protein
MNKLAYYNRQNEPWNDKEVEDIKTEYEIKRMTISEIADIHRRTPSSIGYKVKNIGLIERYNLSRGYMDYKNSKLYKEIVSNIINKNIQSKINTEFDMVPTIRRRDEIRMMRNEIDELKKDVKEMLRLMNALYDFESQSA